MKHEAFKKSELQQKTRAVEDHLHWMLPKQLVSKERWSEENKLDDVAGYHCQVWKCVESNIGLSEAKKKKKVFLFFYITLNIIL